MTPPIPDPRATAVATQSFEVEPLRERLSTFSRGRSLSERWLVPALRSALDEIDRLRSDALKADKAISAALADAKREHRRACECEEPDPVMQADRKFYCHQCSFETGARPRSLEPEMRKDSE